MKKILVLVVIAALLLCAGCSGRTPEPTNTELPTPETPAAPGTPESSSVPGTETLPAAPSTEAPVPSEPVSAEAPVTEPSATEAPPATTAASEPVDPWSLLGSGGYESGSYTDELGNEFDYSWDLPLLLADTEGARAINADIDEHFRGQIAYEKEYMEEGLSMGITDIGFHGVVWEDVLTIVVCSRGYYDDWTDYGVYCYEASTGRWLDTPMLLERMGISRQTFLDRCKTVFHDRFIKNYRELPTEYYAQTGYYEMLARQTTDNYVNLDLMTYPEEGDVVVVAPILSLAGADYYYEPLELGLGGN